ncbi:hypothetical protein [Phytohabitans rumicis]|uniref:Uncharacterized protein n=1 Tax=Phytohabitans rumicis TaxID=1076125 RepID=A0A6V8LEL3_9ACTN|nr:hypothetical protein [Phytohabitans rumicis]GFJ93251.1 hypothetical protein Prum_068930 [Phytohabitans rumicis]
MTSPLPAPATIPSARAAERFPLVPRRKPVCRSLADRVDRVRHLADLASHAHDEPLRRGAEAHNLAALIASDCGLPDLARDLCWRQFDIFAAHGPHDQQTAKATLQPLVNLGRLHTRDGNGTAGYQILRDLLHGAKSRSDAVVDGRTIAFDTIIRPGDDHRDVVQWLWTVLLADGLRALCRAGRWAEALHQAEHHNGVGQRLFDGRQIAVIAACLDGNPDTAIALLKQTATADPWEDAIAACLTVMCSSLAERPTSVAIDAMIGAYCGLDQPAEHALFLVRLGLLVVDLAGDAIPIDEVIAKIESTAAACGDAYAAKEILNSGAAGRLTEHTSRTLAAAVQAASLGTGMPPDSRTALLRSVGHGETALQEALAR